MLKIITKSAHNALLYQIEDLKKKLENGLKINDEIFNELIAKNNTIRERNRKINELENAFDLISKESETNRNQLTRCSQRHKSAALRNEKLQKANTSLLSKNESLTAENHRLGNLLQVKCDEVRALEKKVDSTGLLANDFNKLKANANAIERKTLDAVNMLLNIPRRAKDVNSAITILKDALKIRQ